MEEKRPISSEIKEDFKLKIEINKWEQKTNKSTGKLEVLFNIELFSEINNKKWNVYHSIQDFKDFIANLSSICVNLPEYPNFKSLEKETTSSSIISKAFSTILEFLNNISYRSDIFNSKYYKDFFQLENHLDDLKKYEPKEKLNITKLKFDVSDIVLFEKSDLLIVGCGYDINQNLLKKINFWSKNDKKGQLNIYKINNTQEQSYISLGEIDTESEISCLCASEETKNLLVGYYNGTIQIFDLVELAGSFNELKAKNTFVINNKNNRILNIGFNPSDNYFYAACYDDIMISMGQINSKTIETFPGSENNLCGFNYIDKYDHALKDFVIEMDEEGKLYIGVIDKESKSLNLLFVFTVQLPKLCFFKANFENNHIYIGDKEGNIEIMSFNISHSSEKEVDIKVEKIFNTCLSGNQQNKFSSLITGNFPYKINDIWFNPRKKEIILGLENGTVQILSHFKNFAEYIIYEDNKNKEKKSVNKLYFDKLNSILYIGGVQKNISAFEFPENYNSEICRRLQDSNSFELLNGSKICRNEIDKGYPKTTKSFRRKSLIDKLSKKK